jgi:hypothetical protein
MWGSQQRRKVSKSEQFSRFELCQDFYECSYAAKPLMAPPTTLARKGRDFDAKEFLATIGAAGRLWHFARNQQSSR